MTRARNNLDLHKTPLPIAAHNCYSESGSSPSPLARALGLGCDNIEIDVTWDDRNERLIVGHEPIPIPWKTYQRFEDYFIPAIETHWNNPRPDGAPTILTIDWKTTSSKAVSYFKDFLDSHSSWFSSAPKAVQGLFTQRALTVCFTGQMSAIQTYESLLQPSEFYRAFSDRKIGEKTCVEDVDQYVIANSSTYCRFLSVSWGHVEPPGLLNRVGPWTSKKRERLRALISSAHTKGYRVRFYTLNGHTGNAFENFENDDEAHVRWFAARQDGADWIATDEYEEIVREFGRTNPN